MLKKDTIIGLVRSLLEIGEFVGLTETAKAALSEALEELSRNGCNVADEFNKTRRLLEFSRSIHESRMVIFEIALEHENAQKGGLQPLGPISNARLMLSESIPASSCRSLGGLSLRGTKDEFESFARMYLFCDIDHELALFAEGRQGVLQGLSETVSVQAPYPIEILNTHFI